VLLLVDICVARVLLVETDGTKKFLVHTKVGKGNDYELSGNTEVKKYCESDKECNREGGDYRCDPDSLTCILSYGWCDDGCDCQARHGDNMKCISTIAPLGASMVCVKRDPDDVPAPGLAAHCEESDNKTAVIKHDEGESPVGGAIRKTDNKHEAAPNVAPEPEDCESDEECKRDGGDYRCDPDSLTCILSYGWCDDGCDCQARHGDNMKCISTIAPLGASMVCVKRDPDDPAVHCKEDSIAGGAVKKTDNKTAVIKHDGGESPVGGAVRKTDNKHEPEDCESDEECKRDGGDYRCDPDSLTCILSYGWCDDGCDCQARHGDNMKCISTIAPLGASMVCVKRDEGEIASGEIYASGEACPTGDSNE